MTIEELEGLARKHEAEAQKLATVARPDAGPQAVYTEADVERAFAFVRDAANFPPKADDPCFVTDAGPPEDLGGDEEDAEADAGEATDLE
jgi:hypothetical protein